MVLTGYPHTACIHFIACSMDGKLYTLFACRRACRAFFDGFRGCQCPLCCTKAIRYRPLSSRMPINNGSPLHVMSTSCSLCTVTPSFVNIDIVPSSDVLPTLISELGKSLNESALAAQSDNCLNGRRLTYRAVLLPPLATPTCFVDGRKIGRPTFLRSRSLR
jgi:hypothetical protein